MGMSIRQTDTFARLPFVQSEEERVYPAEFHFRIITETEAGAEALLKEVLSAYRVTAPLAASRSSSAGRYQAYGVSVELRDRAEHAAFDAALKRVPGVRFVL